MTMKTVLNTRLAGVVSSYLSSFLPHNDEWLHGRAEAHPGHQAGLLNACVDDEIVELKLQRDRYKTI